MTDGHDAVILHVIFSPRRPGPGTNQGTPVSPDGRDHRSEVPGKYRQSRKVSACAREVFGAGSAQHLRWLRDKLNDRFTAGIVLHLGSRSSSFGDRIHAVPVSALWGHAML